MANETALREAVKRLVCAAESVSQVFNTSIMDHAISEVEKALQYPLVADCLECHGTGYRQASTAHKDGECPVCDATGEAHPQASPPPVQGEVTRVDSVAASELMVVFENTGIALGQPEWRAMVKAFAAHRVAHSQPDTQEGEA